MRRLASRAFATAIVLGAALLAHAVGNGDVIATPGVTITTITSPTAAGSGSTTLQNTTSATTYNVLLGSDATCDPELTLSVAGGNPITSFAPQTSRSLQLGCPARGSAAMLRCLHHATNSSTGTALADFLSVCLYGDTPGSLVPDRTTIDFGAVAIGGDVLATLSLQHAGTSGTIARVYLQTTDLDGNFRFSTPCNPDTTSCDAELAAGVGPGSSVAVQIRCTPQTAGTHTAELYVGTNTFQLMSTGVTLQCTGTGTTQPVLAVAPANVALKQAIEVADGSATTIVRLANAGSGTLLVRDVRTVDVDGGAAADWTYTATGACTGTIQSACSLDAGEQVDLAVKFDPSSIGRRRATLLISYRDVLDRAQEIPLDGTGGGGALRVVSASDRFVFGQVPVGRMEQVQVALGNSGNRDASAMLSLPAGATPPFTIGSPTTAVVTPTATTPITLACAPTMVGSANTTLSVDSMDLSEPIALNASCEGTNFALYATPSALAFDELRVGTAASTRTIQLASTGAPLTLTGQPQLEIGAPAVTLGPLSSTTTPATFDVTITPDADGQISTRIAISATNGETIHIPLEAKIATATYTVQPTLDLGTFCVNEPTASSNLSLLADGTARITIQTPSLARSPSPFQLSFASPSQYPTLIATGGLATVAITPARQTQVMTVSDTLTWHSDVANALTATTELTARYVDTGGAIAPPAIDFGKVVAHLFVDDGKRVIIQNCNDTPLELNQPVIRSPFSIDSPNFPSMLGANESLAFSVGFHPTRVGPVVETLRITSPQLPDAPLVVTLFGEGVATEEMPDAGVGSNGLGSTSFYACSCSSGGHPLGALPIVLALGVIVRRRRGSS